jgi:hypothetical protein
MSGMTLDIEHDSFVDALGRDVRCRHATEIPVLGIPTRFESNAPSVIEIAHEGFGRWSEVLSDTPLCDAGPVLVRIVLDATIDEVLGAGTHRRLVYRMPDAHRLLLAGPGVIGVADATRLQSYAWVAPPVVSDREHFRYSVLEALANFHLSVLDRQPLHAACVERDGLAVLLVGPAGVGKSTLTYTAAREGCRIVAEDIVWLQLRDTFAIWGLAARLHLPPDSARFFPELRALRPMVQSSGEEKLVVPVEPQRAARNGRVASAAVCLLGRSDRRSARLARATSEEIATALGTFETGFDLFRGTIGPAIERLSRRPGWRLLLTDDPRDAIPELHRLFGALTDPGA